MNARRTQRLLRFVLLLVVVLMGGFLVRGCERYRIPDADDSMSPLYPGGSRVVCEVLDADDQLERGMDVVYAMDWKGTLHARFGRIRALPGDVVGVDADGLLTVNGERVGPINIRGEPAGVVPEGKVYVLALNPAALDYPDSRRLGFLDRSAVRARIRARWSFGG
jgi:hypothetical protein